MSSLDSTVKNPLQIVASAFRYLMAPFYPSEWKKSALEIKTTTPEKIKNVTIKVGLYYVLFSPLVAMPFYNTCIFHPYVCGDYQLSEIAGVKKQDAFFSSKSSTRLHGWYFEKPNAKKTILVSHGNAGNLTHRNDLVKLLLESGASVFIYDYSGFGLSKGSPTVDGCCDDTIAAYDYLVKEKKIPAKHILLYGESIGTAFTCQLAAKRPSAGVILQSAFQSLPQIAGEKMPLFRVYPPSIFPVNQLDSLAYVKGEHPPLLLIHGLQDSLIPAHNADDLFNAASGEKYIVRLPKAGHNDVPYNVTYECMVALNRFCNE